MASWAQDGSDDEVLVLCRLPDFEASELCTQAENLLVEGLETDQPRLVINGDFRFTGTHGRSVGTNLFFSSGTLAANEMESRAEVFGKSTHIVHFEIERQPHAGLGMGTTGGSHAWGGLATQPSGVAGSTGTRFLRTTASASSSAARSGRVKTSQHAPASPKAPPPPILRRKLSPQVVSERLRRIRKKTDPANVTGL
mmetsp:Transcript_61744/g.108143  ORF Transcript_61744/g.108143 Transcript_61744/m.108143 type:complete len:197 (+) Transcript_61744:126-716(+)